MGVHPTLLFTLPNATIWTLPHKDWHLDMPRLPNHGVTGVQIFAFLETVETGGGGTLAVTGSNNMADRLRFVREVGHVGNVELQVVEMTGEAGDVYFMDLWNMSLLNTLIWKQLPWSASLTLSSANV